MRKELISLFLVLTLVISTGLASGLNINSTSPEANSNQKIPEGKIMTLGVGGWHDETSMTQDGDQLTDIYKTGNGGWEYPYDGNCLHFWAQEVNGNSATTTAEYTFDINEGPVQYVTYFINYKDVGIFSDSPDAMIYKWDGTWDTISNIGDHHWGYDWEQHTFDSNSNLYANSDGEIRIAARAWDDGSWPHQDDISAKKMKIAYKAADEEIFDVTYTCYDDDGDGSDDSISMTIDVDVGDFGDGTTVDVTAICELVDPNSNVVDSGNITWTIVDHQMEYGNINLTALNGPNGDYTINVIIYDSHGNNESSESETYYLEPDPQRTITFYTDPYDVGEIELENSTYYYGDSTLISDGAYDITATPDEYYAFSSWDVTGGISVYDPNSATTNITVTGDGTITANFIFTLATVFFYIAPEDSGWIEIEGIPFENGTGCYVEYGTYTISAEKAEPDYYFYYWDSTGNITFDDIYAQSTTVDIQGDGFIIAYFVLNEPPDIPSRPYGPISGEINVEYAYSTSTTDVNGGDVYYKWDWGDGSYSDWLGPYNSGDTCQAKHKWTGPREYQIKVKAKDEYDAETDWSEALTVTMYGKPSAPKITGPNQGKPGIEYEYTFVSNDPDEEDLYYYIEWGDGEFEEWIGPYSSGEEVKVSHTWDTKKVYTIRAMAKDTSEVVSEWGTHTVSMPRDRSINIRLAFLQQLIKNLVIIRQILNSMIIH